MKKNSRIIIILILIILAVAIFWITTRDNDDKFNMLAVDFLEKFYNVSHSDGEELFGQTTAVEGELIQLDESLRDIYADIMTVDCYDRMVANRILGSTHYSAYQRESSFRAESIKFKEGQEKYGDQYYVYTIDLIQYYTTSREIINEWNIEASMSFTEENGELKIKDVEIPNTELLSKQ